MVFKCVILDMDYSSVILQEGTDMTCCGELTLQCCPWTAIYNMIYETLRIPKENLKYLSSRRVNNSVFYVVFRLDIPIMLRALDVYERCSITQYTTSYTGDMCSLVRECMIKARRSDI